MVTEFTNTNRCPLCRIARRESPAVIITENEDVMAIMDLYPATLGHILILPKEHVEHIFALPVEIGIQVMALAIRVAQAVQQHLNPAGLNLIQANGAIAGQTINHFHLHIVPRYEDDGIIIQFGHGSAPAKLEELEGIATKIRPGLS